MVEYRVLRLCKNSVASFLPNGGDMDRGKQLSARIVKLSRVKKPWERIHFDVAIDG